MSGSLGEALVTSNDEVGIAEAAEEKESAAQDMTITSIKEMDCGLKENRLIERKKSAAIGCKDVEWTQLYKGVENTGQGNSGRVAKSDDLSSSTVASVSPQNCNFMGQSEAGIAWDYQRIEERNLAERYFPSLETIVPSSTGNASVDDCGLRDLQHSGNDQELLADVFRRCTSGYGAAALDPVEVSKSRSIRADDFKATRDPSAAIGSQFTVGEPIAVMPQQNSFTSSRGLGMPSPASMQQLTRTPNQAIRNLFPENSSGISRRQQHRSWENVEEQKHMDGERQLVHDSKKLRRQGGHGGLLLSLPSPTQADCTSGGASLVSSGPYRNASVGQNQLGAPLTTVMDNSTYATSSPFLPSFLVVPGRSSADLSPAASPSPAKSSTFQASGEGMLFPEKNFPEGSLSKSPVKDYVSYNREGSVAERERFVSERNAYLDLGDRKQCAPNFMFFGPARPPSEPSMFNFCPTGWQSPLDSKGRAPWPTGFLSMPAAGSSAQPSPVVSTSRILHDPEQRSDIRVGWNEARKSLTVPETGMRLLIQKLLTSTDVGSLGRIILPKKEAETHLPHLQHKENVEMCMFDYDSDRTWTMKYRYWPNNKSRMYLLENTGDFAKFHSLQQGDWIYIYRESLAHYVLRAKKMSVAPILPAPQIVIGAGPVAPPVV